MKLATFVVDEIDRVGMCHGENLLDLLPLYALYLSQVRRDPQPYETAQAVIPADIVRFLARGDESMEAARLCLRYAQQLIDDNQPLKGLRGETICHPVGEVRLKAPLPRPGKLICIGRNYKSMYRQGEPYCEYPWAWLTASSSIIGPEEPIVRPAQTRELDYEVELAVVIGKGGKHISKQRALDYVAGYTVINDVMDVELLRLERELRTRFLQKSLDTFSPMGPYLVTKDEVADPQNLNLELRVNGETRQRSNTAEMVCGIRELIAYLSQMTLEPGDIISTGTPAGNAWARPDPENWFLRPGDLVEAEVQTVGILRNRVMDERDVSR